MASSSGGNDPLGPQPRDELKSQFSTREGLYRLASALEISRSIRPAPLAYGTLNTTSNQTNGPSPPFRLTFITLADGVSTSTPPSSLTNSSPTHSKPDLHNDTDHSDKFVFNYGKELFVYSFIGSRKIADIAKPIDKRVYKGTFPSCHDFNPLLATNDNLSLLIGFSGGQIQLVDPISKEVNKLYNEDRSIDKTRVTCIRWVPNSTNLFFVSHGSGNIYLYNAELTCGTTVPHFQIIKQGPGYAVSTVKSKTPRNPLTKWMLGEGAINEFAFSPCGLYWASVSQDGFLRIFRFDSHDLEGITRSYFGGLICVCWSPDSKYLCVGGEDDLVTIWSFRERRVVARGQGHKSWVSVVAFDPYTTTYGDSDGNDELNPGCEPSESSRHCQNHISHQTTSNSCHVSNVLQSELSGTSSHKQNHTDSLCHTNSTSHMCSSASVANTKKRTSVTLSQNNYLVNSGDQSVFKNSVTNRFARPSSEHPSNIRLSMSETTGTRIPACYRVGSVGQDTQLCLWDLTEDVLQQPFGKSCPATATRILDTSDSNPNFYHSKMSNSHFTRKTVNGSPPPLSKTLIGNSTSPTSAAALAYSSSQSIPNVSGCRHDRDEPDSITKSQCHSNIVSSSTAEAKKTMGNSNKKGSISSTTNENGSSIQSNSSSGHSHGILSLRFGGLVGFGGGSDKNHGKEHKRNFSLGSKNNYLSGIGNSTKTNGGGVNNSHLGLLGVNDPLKLIGTEACPRLDECPLLEPLICKKISHERLTALIFREESVVTACQDGVICTWDRPGEDQRISSPTLAGSQHGRNNKILAQDDSFSYNNDASKTEL